VRSAYGNTDRFKIIKGAVFEPFWDASGGKEYFCASADLAIARLDAVAFDKLPSRAPTIWARGELYVCRLRNHSHLSVFRIA
jgi:hypothetical protein